MRIGNRLKVGVAAAIGTGLLVVTPMVTNAHGPESWNICPAVDAEPMCGLVAHPASDGAGSRPAVVPQARRSSNDGAVDVSCSSTPILLIVACAE
jgi:hypothetical protein